MALVVADRVKETTTSTGTGAISLAGAEPNFRTFASVLSDADTTYYAIIDDSNLAFEVGLGTYASSGNTITRTTVLASSNSNNAVNFSAGTKDVFLTYPADKSVNRDASGNVSVSGGVTATSFTGNITGDVTGDVTGAVTATQVDLTGQGDLRLQDASGGQYVALQAPATVGSSFTFTLPSADGSADQLLKTDGSGNLSFTTINASPSFSATASGAISNGNPVVVNADGTVSAVATESASQTAGTHVEFEAGSTTWPWAVYDSNAQKVVIAYQDGGDSDYGKAVVGTVSGTSISFGTPVQFNAGYTSRIAMAYDANAQKVVIVYRDSGDSDKGNAVVGTVSGTSISFGTEATFESGGTQHIGIAYDANAQKVVIVYMDENNSSYGTAIVGTISGTDISFGTPVVYRSSSSNWNSAAYDSDNQKVVVAAKFGSDGWAYVGTVSGTSISFGSGVRFNTGGTEYVALAYDANAQKMLIVYSDLSASSAGTAVVGTISGTSISYGSETEFESGEARYMSAVYDSVAQKVVIAYEDQGNSDRGKYVNATIDGTSVTFTSPSNFHTGTTDYIATAFDSDEGKVIITYRDTGDSDKGKALAQTTAYSRHNLTSENYIGISDAAYSNGATATVQVVGSVDDAQSSLTPGQTYYVQTNGTLATSAGSPSVVAGTAVAATKIIVKG